MRVMVLNGPSLNMLGIRETEIYGQQTYESLIEDIRNWAKELNIEIECYQSNHEGELIDLIQKAYFEHFDGIIINPGAYTHTSIALLDALKAVTLPTVEVHLSNLSQREGYRKISYVREACFLTIMGKGKQGYKEALIALKERSN